MTYLGFFIFIAIFLPIYDMITIKIMTGKDMIWWIKYHKCFKATNSLHYPK